MTAAVALAAVVALPFALRALVRRLGRRRRGVTLVHDENLCIYIPARQWHLERAGRRSRFLSSL